MPTKKRATKPIKFDQPFSTRGFDELPFLYFDPINQHIQWLCIQNKEKECITSIVENQRTNESKEGVVGDIEEAIRIRNDLIKAGWVERKLPTFEINQEVLTEEEKVEVMKKQQEELRLEKLEEAKKKEEERLEEIKANLPSVDEFEKEERSALSPKEQKREVIRLKKEENKKKRSEARLASLEKKMALALVNGL